MDLIDILDEEVNNVLNGYGNPKEEYKKVGNILTTIGVTLDNVDKLKRGDKIRATDLAKGPFYKEFIAYAGYLACNDIISYFKLEDKDLTEVLSLRDKEFFENATILGGVSLKYIKKYFPVYERFLADVSDIPHIDFVALVRQTENTLKNCYYTMLKFTGKIDTEIPSDETLDGEERAINSKYFSDNEVTETIWDDNDYHQRKEYMEATMNALKSMHELNILKRAYERFSSPNL